MVRAITFYDVACWPTTKCIESSVHATEMCMLRWLLGVSFLDHVSNDSVHQQIGLAPIFEKMWMKHLQ